MSHTSQIKKIAPISLYTYGSNSIRHSSNGGYVPFIGENDNLARLLLECRLNSPTQSACISTIVTSIIGSGIKFDSDKINEDFKKWTKCINNRSNSLFDVTKLGADGFQSTGNSLFEIVKGEVSGKKFVKVYNHSSKNFRLSGIEVNECNATSVIISKTFGISNFNPNFKGAVTLPLYNCMNTESENWKEDEKNKGIFRTCIHLSNMISEFDYYGLPDSISSLIHQIIESRMSGYNFDMFDNQMVIGGTVVIKSPMSPVDAYKEAKMIIEEYSGVGTNGRVKVVSSENGISDYQYIPNETHRDGSYIELSSLAESNIVKSNRWAQEFISPKSSSLGNGSGYLEELWAQKEMMLLNPIRNLFIEKLVEPLFDIYATHMGIKEVSDYTYKFNTQSPYSILSKVAPELYLKRSELRKMANYESDESDEIYIENKKTTTQ